MNRKKLLTIAVTIFTHISLSTASAHVVKTINLTPQEIKKVDAAEINKLKETHSQNTNYTTFAVLGILFCHMFVAEHLPPKAKPIIEAAGSLAGICGVIDIVDWLFLHTYSNHTESDIRFLYRASNFILDLAILHEVFKLSRKTIELRVN